MSIEPVRAERPKAGRVGPHPHVTVLHRVPYKLYVHLTRVSANRHLRMAYHDGTLEIVSPVQLAHEVPSSRLRLVVTTVADALDMVYDGSGGATFSVGGEGPYGGKGKEPDQSFYFAGLERLPKDREPDLNAGDPPPDLWIEVDHRASSAGRLPVYAALGVPEIWRYRVGTKRLQFLRLDGGKYEPVDRSLSLPILTPALVVEALALGDGLPESAWVRRLREWARGLVAGQGPGE